MAAGIAIKAFTLNLSLILHPCVEVATIVVSEIKERLSPKKEPPTTTAVSRGMLVPVDEAIPTAMGVSATMVPTLVPMLSEMKQAAINSPGMSMLAGRILSVSVTVASMLPISLAAFANAPASMKIHIMSIICGCPAPWLKVSILLCSVILRDVAMAYIDDAMKANVMGTL